MEPVPDTGETGFIVQCGQGFSVMVGKRSSTHILKKQNKKLLSIYIYIYIYKGREGDRDRDR